MVMAMDFHRFGREATGPGGESLTISTLSTTGLTIEFAEWIPYQTIWAGAYLTATPVGRSVKESSACHISFWKYPGNIAWLSNKLSLCLDYTPLRSHEWDWNLQKKQQANYVSCNAFLAEHRPNPIVIVEICRFRVHSYDLLG